MRSGLNELFFGKKNESPKVFVGSAKDLMEKDLPPEIIEKVKIAEIIPGKKSYIDASEPCSDDMQTFMKFVSDKGIKGLDLTACKLRPSDGEVIGKALYENS